MKSLDNSTSNNHLKLIGELISSSDAIMICAGHFKKNVLGLILPPLVSAIFKRNASVDIFSSHKDNQKSITKTLKKHPQINFSQTQEGSAYLHSKNFYFQQASKYTAIIGSANLTNAALCTNEELSVVVSGDLYDSTDTQIREYFKNLNLRYACKKTGAVPFKGVL